MASAIKYTHDSRYFYFCVSDIWGIISFSHPFMRHESAFHGQSKVLNRLYDR